MARPKKFSTRVMVRFDDRTLEQIQSTLGEMEDRSDLVREAVSIALALRQEGLYPEVKAYLIANETLEAFLIKAVRRAVGHRKAAIDDTGESSVLTTIAGGNAILGGGSR